MKKILMVEDDQVVSTIYRSKLSSEGFEVVVAADGEEGFKQAGTFKPDVIVLDLGLPKLDGIEVIKQLRAEPANRKLPIIVLTNAYLANRVKDAWAAGATRCVTKSECTPRVLVDIIRKVAEEGASAGLKLKLAEPASGSSPVAPAESSPVSPLNPVIAFPAGAELYKQVNSLVSFADDAPGLIAKLRQKLQELLRATRPESVHHFTSELYLQTRSLAAKAAVAEMTRFARMAAALEALLKELVDRPDLLTASSQRTVVQGIDFLDELLRKQGGGDGEIPVEGVLVVDDEPLSRRAVVFALEKVGLKCIDMDDSRSALSMLSGMPFDLFFLDIDMPGMNGFELCKQIRAMPDYAKTPVVFVSSLTDFQSKAQSMLSGGNDLIAKPFHFLELGVKALIHLWRPQLNRLP
ncbi:MAG TPA: response regulator [Verrucomicrobiae bacterium]